MSLFTQQLSQTKLHLWLALAFLAVFLLFSLSLSTAHLPASFAQRAKPILQLGRRGANSTIATSTLMPQGNFGESVFSLPSSLLLTNPNPRMLMINSAAPQGSNSWTNTYWLGSNSIGVDALAIDLINPSIVCAGTYGNGVYKSTDGGASWNQINTALVNAYVLALAIDPSNSSIIYAGIQRTNGVYSSGGVYKSTNGGTSWSNAGLVGSIFALAIDPSNPSIVYAGGVGGAGTGDVYKSTDGGASWSQFSYGLVVSYVFAVVIDPNNPSVVYAGTNAGVYKSANGGMSWSQFNTGLPSAYVYALAIDPSNPSIVYAGTGVGVYKSINGGVSWNFGLSSADVLALAIDPSNPSIVYAGIHDGGGVGVYKSANSGASWNQFNTGLTNTWLNALAIDKSGRFLHAGTNGGVFDFQYSNCSSSFSSLVSWWPGDGNANDIQSTNNGTLQNGATFVTGKVGQGFSLDGVDDYVQVTHNPNLDPGTGSFTVDAWIRTTANTGTKVILSKYECGGICISSQSNSLYSLAMTNGIPNFNVRDTDQGGPLDTLNNGGQFLTSTGSIADGNYHHLVGVRDQTTSQLLLYVDGALNASAPLNPGANGALRDDDGEADPFLIGAIASPESGARRQFFPGVIDEVQFYNRALSSTEILAIASNAGICNQIIANAGPDQNVRIGTSVILNGANSSAPATPTYSWSFTGKPNGSTATLNAASTVSPAFVPDKEGTYTIKLVVSAAGQSASDELTVRAFLQSCVNSSLSIWPVSVKVRTGLSEILIGSGGSHNYTWSFVVNNSGGTLTRYSDWSVGYLAGPNTGQDIIRLTDPWCGTLDRVIQVIGNPPEPYGVTVSPNTTQGASSITITAFFKSPATQAEYCLDNSSDFLPTPGTCTPMVLSNGGIAASASRSTSGLSFGAHKVSVRGRDVLDWGWASRGTFTKTGPKTVVLLLNGYNFWNIGPHPEQWHKFYPTIDCQMLSDFFGTSFCSSLGTSCPSGAPSGDNVCVVDNLDGRGDINYNLAALASYINYRPWIRDADNLVLIGHSYGGQISRAFAAFHPEKTISVITLDTPHLGAKEAYVWIKRNAHPLTYDRAIQFFSEDGAANLNQVVEYYRSDAQVRLGKNMSVYPIASERLKPVSEATIKFFRELETKNDEIVPIDSQLAFGRLSFDFTQYNRQQYQKQRTFFLTPTSNFGSALHNAILEDQSIWSELYQQKLKPLLGAILQTTGLGNISARTTATQLAVLTNPALPPIYPLRTVKLASGVLTTSVPNSSVNFAIESGQDLVVNLSSNGSNPGISLNGPGGAIYTPSLVNGLESKYDLSLSLDGVSQTFFIHNPTSGNWTLNITAPNSGSSSNIPSTGAPWNLSVGLRSPISMQIELSGLSYLVGETLKVKAAVKQDTVALTGLTAIANLIPSGGGTATNLTLFDDGAHDDGVAGDGVYGGSQVLTATGIFDLTVTVSGSSSLGAFQRQQAGSFSVGTPETTISGGFTETAPDVNNNGKYDSVNWSFNINVPSTGSYTVLGDLASQDGTIVSSAVTKVDATAAGNQAVTLVFPGQDIYRNGKEGAYTLKHLRITVTTDDGERMSGRPTETATTGGPYWSWLSFERDETPSFVWQSPILEQVIRGGSYDLKWTVKDGNGAATIDLYYDTTGSGFAGTPIVTGLEAVNGEMSYSWNVGSLPDGLYYVYARVRNGDFSNALYGGSIRKLTDTDGDGMSDAWETAHGLNPNDASDAYLDPDGDLLTNLDEYLNNTDPHNPDTDGGGEKDGSEVLNGRDPLTVGDDVTGITLLAVSPGQGDSRGSDQVMVLGSGFQNGATVSLGGVAAPSVTFINSTKLLVTVPAHAVGSVSVTVTNPASGGSATKADAFNFLFQFIEPPIAGSNGSLCAGATLNLVASTISGATYSWTGPNGFVSSQQNPSLLSATTAASGTYTVTVTIPGYTFPSTTTTVTVNPIPAAPVISAPSPVTPGTTGLMASVINNAGSFYNWTITNGTITAGQGTNQITFTAGVGGTLSLQVTETNLSGCQSAVASVNIPVCAFSLSPMSQTFNASGGSGSVMVTAANSACAWTAASNDAWITLSNFNGIGNGSVGFMVAANTGSQRTGTITIAGQTFTVMQDAFVCPTIIVNPVTLPNSFVSAAYNQPLSATGGTSPYTFTLDSGSFPPGVNIIGTNLTGTPTTTGVFNFSIKATDSLGCMGTRAYTVVISGTGLQFYPLAHPVRMVDTRVGATACQAPGAAITGNTSLTVPVRAVCDGLTIPANAAAVTGNVTTVGPIAAGFLTIYPSGATRPQASNSNYQTNQTLNNVFTVGLGAADGAFNVFALSTTNVVVDVTGYFAPPGANGLFFHPLPAPVRLLDTRAGQTACTIPGTPLLAATEFLQQGNAICGIPATAQALVGNATTVGPLAQGFLTLFPSDATRPLIASGNYQSGQTLNSPFTVGLSPSGQFKIYSLQQTNLVVDVLGYFSADASDTVGIGLLFSPMTPARLLDTRTGQTACFTPGVAIPATTDTPQAARGTCTIPATAQAIVGNATTVSPASGGFLTFWPSNATRPNAATSNFAAGVNFNRHYKVGLGADGAFNIYALTSTHLVVDVSGSFAP